MSTANVSVPANKVAEALDGLIDEAKFRSDHLPQGEERLAHSVVLADLQKMRAKYRPPLNARKRPGARQPVKK